MKKYLFFVGTFFCFLLFLQNAKAASLVPHQAGYDITLSKTKSSQSVADVTGKMTFELQDICDSWITNQLVALRYVYTNGKTLLFSSNASSFEAKDSSFYQFNSRQTHDDNVVEKYKGKATKKGEGQIIFSVPEETLDLHTETLFPIEHLVHLLEKAESEEQFFYAKIFDGSQVVSSIPVNAVVEPYSKKMDFSKIKGAPELLNIKAWGVRLAVFEEAGAVPSYEMFLVLHQNGIISNFFIEYPDFSLQMTLESLQSRQEAGC